MTVRGLTPALARIALCRFWIAARYWRAYRSRSGSDGRRFSIMDRMIPCPNCEGLGWIR